MKNTILIIIISLIGLFSCISKKNISHQVVTKIDKIDSVRYVERVTIDTIRVPAETLEVIVPLEVLRVDTIIQYRNGRVRTEIRYINGNIEATSSCDSLEKLVLNTQQEFEAYRTQNSDKNQVYISEEKKGVGWFYKASAWVCGILIVLILAYVIFKIIKNKIKPPFGIY